jgi:hypothetical protein
VFLRMSDAVCTQKILELKRTEGKMKIKLKGHFQKTDVTLTHKVSSMKSVLQNSFISF